MAESDNDRMLIQIGPAHVERLVEKKSSFEKKCFKKKILKAKTETGCSEGSAEKRSRSKI